ncbi:MAG: hypothetical protein KME46_04140 [Brasilonema angustatum HA4187-MV1]|jgi:hypothetical protein|nr:hypothetical protein [Brasilonema angustatum HA4187-MV1]
MAMVNRATSLVVTIHDSNKLTPPLWEPIRLSTAMLTRLWWHTKAYGTVLMIALVTLLSLIFLRIYCTSRKLLLVSTHQNVARNKCHTLTDNLLD